MCLTVMHGLCAPHQLRLESPAGAELVAGVKRDIKLLGGVEAGAGDLVTVLDISLDSNRRGLLRLLEREQASNILITIMRAIYPFIIIFLPISIYPRKYVPDSC
jgi:hypothetical protein